MRPEDFTGKFVFHCHITFHEDHGMMAAIQVLKNPTAEQLRPAVAHHGSLMVSSAAYHSHQPPAPGSASPFLCTPLALRREHS